MFAQRISMPRFKSTIFHQNSPKIKLFLQNNATFSSVGGLAPGPLMAFGGSAPRLPKQLPPLRIFGYKRLNMV